METNSPAAMFSETSDTAVILVRFEHDRYLSKMTEPRAGLATVPAMAFVCAGIYGHVPGVLVHLCGRHGVCGALSQTIFFASTGLSMILASV